MSHEESEIYIAREPDGTYITVQEYAASIAGLHDPTPIYCPNCHQKNDEQLLTYDTEKRRFIHQKVSRDCYRDDRTSDRDHPQIQQTVYKKLRNDDHYTQTDIEFPLKRWQNCLKLRFDVGAILPEDANLRGALVEVQHQSGTFSDRLYRRVQLAQKRNCGVYVVFSPSGRYRHWFGKRLSEIHGFTSQIGSFNDGSVNLGTMIRPEDDISVLRTESSREVNGLWDDSKFSANRVTTPNQ